MSDHHVTKAGHSVLEELGLDRGYVVKAKLALMIQRSIAEQGLTQRDAAARMPISQSKLSLLTRGKLDDISQAKLEECLNALGHDVEIAVSARHEGKGAVVVREYA